MLGTHRGSRWSRAPAEGRLRSCRCSRGFWHALSSSGRCRRARWGWSRAPARHLASWWRGRSRGRGRDGGDLLFGWVLSTCRSLLRSGFTDDVSSSRSLQGSLTHQGGLSSRRMSSRRLSSRRLSSRRWWRRVWGNRGSTKHRGPLERLLSRGKEGGVASERRVRGAVSQRSPGVSRL